MSMDNRFCIFQIERDKILRNSNGVDQHSDKNDSIDMFARVVFVQRPKAVPDIQK